MELEIFNLEFRFLTNLKFSKGDTVSIGELNVTFYSLSWFFQVILLCLRVEFSVQICQRIVLSSSVLSGSGHFCSDIFQSIGHLKSVMTLCNHDTMFHFSSMDNTQGII